MKYFRVKNWEKYQHRDVVRTKTMPWCKLFAHTLDDADFERLPADLQLTFFKILMLACRNLNQFKYDKLSHLRIKLGLKRNPKIDQMVAFGLLEWMSDEKSDSNSASTSASKPAVNSASAIREEKIREEDSRCASSLRAENAGGFKPNSSSSSASSSSLLELMKSAWNRTALNPIEGLSKKRASLMDLCLLEEPSMEYWENVFRRAFQSEFLRDSQKGWPTTIDWVLQHRFEILEGKYDSMKGGERHEPGLALQLR